MKKIFLLILLVLSITSCVIYVPEKHADGPLPSKEEIEEDQNPEKPYRL